MNQVLIRNFPKKHAFKYEKLSELSKTIHFCFYRLFVTTSHSPHDISLCHYLVYWCQFPRRQELKLGWILVINKYLTKKHKGRIEMWANNRDIWRAEIQWNRILFFKVTMGRGAFFVTHYSMKKGPFRPLFPLLVFYCSDLGDKRPPTVNVCY